jgi:hypothetical protein
MKIVVGGLGRKSGKTAMVCRILRLFPGRRWLAVKLSPHTHGDVAGSFSIREDNEAGEQGDTRRYLAAGAARALLVEGDLEAAMPELAAELARSENWIVESNAAAGRLQADFTFFVADPAAEGEEEKLRRFFSRLE